ncbi:hypothetical protein N7478_001410 [Penicillium angulare]|uniref:uncharacterized protein n=1 Tax=Penicillium angulare TaxID=116970 RepID=UPI0025413F44|nr:uncharacterized protein N7478_001410 [Penicillium angulare]KAJ5292159.1 hypothetical protein N7478_001410 [Penicillium angulare]
MSQETRIRKTGPRSLQAPSIGLASSDQKEQVSSSKTSGELNLADAHSPGKTVPLTAVNENQAFGVDSRSPEHSSAASPPASVAYSRMKLSAFLPPPLKSPLAGPIFARKESPPTFHQLLLVLNYIFISAMLPDGEAAMWRIIYRHSADWEREFVLQYDKLLWWLISTRDALAQAAFFQTVSLVDLEPQIRWVLFMLGRESIADSSFLQACFQRDKYPYRPFGARASIALICLAFNGVQLKGINGYESKDIWPCDEQYYALMASRLGRSPLFKAGVTFAQLKATIIRLYQAFQLEEERVALTMPQEIYYDDDASTYEYFQRDFLSLDPRLLPRICQLLQPSGPPVEDSAYNLASTCATVFQRAPSVDALEATFANIPEILQSQADRAVVIEMFHVRLFQQLKQPVYGQSSYHSGLDQS